MTNDQKLIKDCVNLSSGTIATLTGHKRYDEIEKIQTDFVLWVIENPNFTNWRQAWNEFQGQA